MTTAERYGIVLGVVGFVLSLANLAWTVWAWWVQHRVKLHHKVGIHLDPQGGVRLVAKLVNDGHSPLFIDRVVLESARPIEGPGGPHPQLILDPDPVPPGGRETPIEPGDYRDYVLVRDRRLSALGDIRNSHQYQYWISVRTPKREVLKIRDAGFLDTLKDFAEGDDPGPSVSP